MRLKCIVHVVVMFIIFVRSLNNVLDNFSRTFNTKVNAINGNR